METILESDFIQQAFNFWLNDQEHIRSPFPSYIHHQLKPITIENFTNWLNNLHEDAKDEVNDEVIAERFEEILFEKALDLVITEDEKITILYPFMPRVDDKIIDQNQENCIIQSRFITSEGDYKFLELTCIKENDKTTWKTKFELPK